MNRLPNRITGVIQYFKKSLHSLKSGGEVFLCPVCSNRVTSFTPLPEHYELNRKKFGNPYSLDEMETLNHKYYSCPHCGASDRDRLYATFLRERFQSVEPSLRILDFAPSQALQIFLQKQGLTNYRSADLFMENVDDKVDICDLNIYADESFDAFICSHILEHVQDDRKAMSELFRVLKRGGWGILMVPINLSIETIDEDPTVMDTAERWRRFGQDDHIRHYSKLGFIKRVQASGFKLNQLTEAYFGEAAFRKFGISSSSVLYIVEK